MVATIVTTFGHVFWLIMFVNVFDWGIFGVALASTVTNGLQLSVCLIYASKKEAISEAIFMPTKDAFIGLRMYMGLAIPATLMLCGEWWFFELLTLTSGYIGVNE